MYADNITKSMKLTIDETNRRRKKQDDYNKLHNIKPKPIIKKRNIEISESCQTIFSYEISRKNTDKMDKTDIKKMIKFSQARDGKSKKFKLYSF